MDLLSVARFLECEFQIKGYEPKYWMVDKYGIIWINFDDNTREQFRVGINNRWEWWSGSSWVGYSEFKKEKG